MSGESRNELVRLLDDANDDRRYLRARAEKAEAERDAATRRAMDAEEGEANLQLGIQALADEREKAAAKAWQDCRAYEEEGATRIAEGARSDARALDYDAAALRALLSPTPGVVVDDGTWVETSPGSQETT